MAADHELQQLMPHEGPPTTHGIPLKHNTDDAHATASAAPDSSRSSHDGSKIENDGAPGWTPLYLRATTLAAFVVCYLVLLVAIVALAIADAKNDGLAAAKSNQHYLWTYGPTAVLAIVAALWGQVEHRTKQAMPWHVLQKQPTPASATLLLDYITPSLPETLLQSFRSSHWPVAVATISSLLIKLLTVASTGLLVLQITPVVHHDCKITASDDFVSGFNPAAIGSTAVLSTLAIENGTLPYEPGTTRHQAFQTMNASHSLSNQNAVKVEGFARSFSAGLTCETAKVTSYDSFCSDRQCHGIDVHIDIDSPTCHVRQLDYSQGCGWQLGYTECDFEDAFGVECNTTTDGHDRNRLVFIYGRMSQNVSANDLGAKILPNETTTVVCEPKYNITSTFVRTDQNGNLNINASEMVTQGVASQPYPAWDLVEGLHTSVQAAGLILGNPYAYSSVANKPWYQLYMFFDSWADAAYPSSDFRDAQLLETAANDLFAMVSAQMAKQNLVAPSDTEIIGTCYSSEQRLRVRGLSLYLMAAALVLLVLMTVILLFNAPRCVTSRDPASIGGMALILSESPSILARLARNGSSGLDIIKKQLQGTQCRSVVSNNGKGPHFSVELLPCDGISYSKPGHPSVDMHAEMKWWRPLSLLPVFKLFVVALLLVLVVVLELLFWKSERDDGLAKVDSQGYVRFSWVYVPAVVMLTAQTLVGMIAFSSVFIFPHYLLRTRASNTRRDILRDYVSQTAIQSVWKSAANRHLPVFFMALAMLLTPLLTIAVSGLYTAQPTDVEQIVSLTTKNQFNSSFIDDDFEDIIPFEQASLNIGLLLTQNFTFPLWTYDDIALPQLELQVPEDLLSNSSVLIGSNVTTSLPAIRAELSCTVVPGNPANFSDMIWNKEDFTGFTDVGCGDTVWPLPGSNAFGFFSLGYNGSVGPGYCGAYGTSETNWRAFVCGSQINQLDVNVTLDASSLAVLEASSDESTSRLFSNRTLTMYRLSSYPSSVIPSIFGSANFADPTTSFYDPGFQAVIYEAGTTDDPNKFPIADYMDDAGFRRLSAGLTHVYRTIIAQTANLALRVPLNTSAPLAPPATVNGTLTNPNVYRLRQSAVSTRILDGLLAAVALCIAVSFGLMDTRRLLPKNPAPIAAGASLLAGEAEMLRPDLLPEGAQWCSDSELEKRGVWDGFVFSLGWWNSGSHVADGRESKRFGIDIGKADA